MATGELDIRDLMLEATAEVQEIVREILDELREPHELDQMRKLWVAAPDDKKERLAMEDPEFFREMMDKMQERRYR